MTTQTLQTEQEKLTELIEQYKVQDLREVYTRFSGIGDGRHGVIYVGLRENGEMEAVKLFHSYEFLLPEMKALKLFEEDGIAPKIKRVFFLPKNCGIQKVVLGMEWIDGKDLAQVHNERGRFTSKEIADIAENTLRLIAPIHRKGYLHKDLKGCNIMLRSREITADLSACKMREFMDFADPNAYKMIDFVESKKSDTFEPDIEDLGNTLWRFLRRSHEEDNALGRIFNRMRGHHLGTQRYHSVEEVIADLKEVEMRR